MLTVHFDNQFAEATYLIPNVGGFNRYETRYWFTANAWMAECRKVGDEYQLTSFWCDKEHMRNCLGLTKGHENIYEQDGCRLVELSIEKAKSPNWKAIVQSVAVAFEHPIKLYVR